MKLRCLVVDDEPLARRVLEKYIADMPMLELVASCADAFEALEILQSRHDIRLLFLDINMPRLSGISLLRTLPQPPMVIFTTAYPEFAVEGFELEAVDYLLKPFAFERFVKAVNKAAKMSEANGPTPSSNDFLLLRADKKLYRLPFAQILFLQAYGDYVKVHTSRQVYLTKERLQNLQQSLPEDLFLQVHRSYVVALNAIAFVEGNQIDIAGTRIPVAITYREQLMLRLGEVR